VLSFVVMFFPSSKGESKALFTLPDLDVVGLQVPADLVPVAAAILTLAAVTVGVLRQRGMSFPATALQRDDAAVGRGDASGLIAEAKRELG
jgi:hypothetical protein